MASPLVRNNSREVEDRLKKIGEDGFAVIEEVYGNRPVKSTSGLQAHHSKPYVYHGHQVFTVKQKPVIAHDQSAEYYGVLQVLNVRHQQQQPQPEPEPEPEINSDQAAYLYGGMVFVDHRFRP